MNCGTFHAIFISFVNVEIRHLQMAESNHITRRHSDTLVDSLIHTMVWLRDKLHLILMTGESLTDSYSR